MFLVTGLGNPGSQYENTPHNAGFIFVDILKEYLEKNSKYQVDDWNDESKLFKSMICKIRWNGEVVGILQKPSTYMNLSGDAVKNILEKFDVEQFILVHDDLDIKLGNIKAQMGKSPKGHKGVLSVESQIKDGDFLRVRIGIENRINTHIPGEDYVLQKLTKEELNTLYDTIQDFLPELILDLNI